MRLWVGVLVGGLLGAGAAGVAVAQPAPPAAPEAASGIISYPASYYEQFQSNSAKDMVEKTPGFTLNKGDDVRGYGGAAGNVLIDGQRPASKSVGVDVVLQRIPSESVVRVDVIRGGAPGIDMQGQSVVVNVVRKSGAQSTRAVLLAPRIFQNGFVGFISRAEASWQSGPYAAEGQLTGRRDLSGDSGEGGQTRRHGAGDLYETGPFHSRVATGVYQANGAASWRAGFGALRLNAAAEYDTSDRHDVAQVHPLGGAAFDDIAEIAKRGKSFELGGDVERALTSRLTFNGIALQRLDHQTLAALTHGRSAAQASNEQSDAGETILRGVLKAGLPHGVALEAGAEGAFNYLDAVSALTVGGAPVLLPSANVRVEERRGEGFVTATLHPAPSLTLESGVRVETSTIRQTGGANQQRTFTFPKPRLVATWGSGGSQIRVRFERTVGQLIFKDFAASSELEAGSVNAGNANLQPERSWLSEAAFEQRFWGNGDIVVTVSHSDVEEVVDLIPIAGLFDAPGNIGSGTRDEAKVSLTLPLDRFALSGAQLRINGTWRRSRVTDPVTGAMRTISGQRPFEGDLTATKSLPKLNSALGVEGAFGFRETFYRINEIRTTQEAPLWKFYWDWAPRPDLSFRIQAENLNSRERVRTRTSFIGPRSTGRINFVERRSAAQSPAVVFRIRKAL